MSSYVDDLIDKLIDMYMDWDLYDEARNTALQAAKEIQRLSEENELLKRGVTAG